MEVIDRLLTKISRSDRGCWLFTGARDKDGYGLVRVGGRRGTLRRAHRLMLEAIEGELPPGVEACHTCDTPACIAPNHLFPGTHADNMRDASAKGRLRANRSRLARFDVEVARALVASGRITQRQAARELGVSPGYMSEIANLKKLAI